MTRQHGGDPQRQYRGLAQFYHRSSPKEAH
jgi:hypothetical protein